MTQDRDAPALSVGLEEDLLPLSTLLHQRGVAHRIFEQHGQQVLVVQRASQAAEVMALYRAWRSGEVRIEVSTSPGHSPEVSEPDFAGSWRASPVTLALILCSIAAFLLFLLNRADLLGYLIYSPLTPVNGETGPAALGGQYWRLVTPAFLHFGWLHIAFNCLWLWELGCKVERVMGHLNMFLLFLVIAIVSNTSQHVFGGPGVFGGMSGVVYGLLGFSWVGPLFQPAWRIQPSGALMLFMLGWLVLCMVGAVEELGLGAVANAAHLGGLLCGALLGALFGLVSGRRSI